jgi:hypothetical protein
LPFFYVPSLGKTVCSQDFVKFIVKGLEGNILQPFDEGNFRKAELAAQNQVQLNQCFGSVSDPDWIRIQSDQLIRIRVQEIEQGR